MTKKLTASICFGEIQRATLDRDGDFKSSIRSIGISVKVIQPKSGESHHRDARVFILLFLLLFFISEIRKSLRFVVTNSRDGRAKNRSPSLSPSGCVVSCRPSNRTCAISLQRGTRSLFAIRFYSQGPAISRSERETRARLYPLSFGPVGRRLPAGCGYVFGVVATGCRRRGRRVTMPMVRCPSGPPNITRGTLQLCEYFLHEGAKSRAISSRIREIGELHAAPKSFLAQIKSQTSSAASQLAENSSNLCLCWKYGSLPCRVKGRLTCEIH